MKMNVCTGDNHKIDIGQLTGLFVVVGGHSRISALQKNSNIGYEHKNVGPDSIFPIMKMKNVDINCFVNPMNQGNKILFFSLGNINEPIARGRRTNYGWTIEKPIYAEEPKWILMEEEAKQSGQRQLVTNNKEDPFYIARGKKMAIEYSQDFEDKHKSHLQRINRANMFPDSKVNSEINLWNNSNLPMYFHPNNLRLISTPQNGGNIQPRDKHSDIMDMLQEPFMISRGKKNLMNKRDEHNLFANAFEFIDANPLRDRRGKLFEQLMKEKDPFYVARGKRDSSIVHYQL
ncbi:hypothetical protein PV326_000547 [Microctonus aethiopoides]|nr:hypothetical protein PV326_000547 [Microctonus aethiopoides]